MSPRSDEYSNGGFFSKLLNASTVKYVISSLLSTLLDKTVYYLLLGPLALGTLISQYTARALSSLLNFNLNRFFVFKSKEKYGRAMLKYYCVCIPQVLIESFLLKYLLRTLLHIDTSPGAELSSKQTLLATCLNFAVQMVIFCVSYIIQKKWVFNGEKETETNENPEEI